MSIYLYTRLKPHFFMVNHRKPMAVIQKTRTVTIAAPFVASFSSRGPQLISRNILKVQKNQTPYSLFFPSLISLSKLLNGFS